MTTPQAAAAEAGVGAEVGPGRRCDFCEEARALVYCRADSARLCLACDRHVHAANAVCSRHPRSLLCDACLSAPSSILLCSPSRRHPRLLCANCDFDALHSRGRDASRAGERRPVEPYSGSPEAVDMLALLGVSVEKEKSLLLDGRGSGGWLDGGGSAADGGSSLLLAEEGWVWETPLILSMEDIVVPTNPCHGFPAAGVPPPPKDRNAACGKHRDEILRQLRGLVKSEACVGSDFELLEAEVGFQPWHEFQPTNMISNNENDVVSVDVPCPEPKVLHKDFCDIDGVPAVCSEHWFETSMEEGKVSPDGPVDARGSVSDAGSLHLMSREDLPLLPPSCGHMLSGVDRGTILSRYKEKRKTRRFDKQIRYESRKVRADGRMRIKGRFAKPNQNPEC